jgi:hypothetical protein
VSRRNAEGKQALPLLQAVIQAPDSRGVGNCESTENALSATLKIVLNPVSGVSLEGFLPGFLQHLPFAEDREECEWVYGALCDLIMRAEPAMMTAENLARFLFIVAESLNTPFVPLNSVQGIKCRRTIQHLQAVDNTRAAELIAQLPPLQHEKLRVMMAVP